MRPQTLKKHLFRLFVPTRAFLALVLAVLIYLLPLGSKPEFIEHNGEIIEISSSPILQSISPPASYATCGNGGTGTNCHTGCCSAGACVVCPPSPDNQPPSISANLNCSNQGNNPWCIGTLSLDLSASDPQGAALLISGTLNGQAFACANGATSCSIPITSEGSGSLTYRVDSATGLSASGSANYQLDASTPALDGSVNSVIGANNWYQSNATLTISASDSVSGLSSITTSLDGGAETIYSGPITFTDGVHTALITATDNAGNVTQTMQTIQVDTLTPSLSTSLNGTSGSNGWYISTVTITPSADDAVSGLATLEASLDGGSWSLVNHPVSFIDGIHTVQFRATDNAGNVTETAQQTVKVDSTTPTISLNINGTKGSNGWYVSNVTVTPNVADATSTIGLLEATVDGGAWSVANSSLSFADGLHSYQFRVTDTAGNFTTTPVQNLKIDTLPPAIDMTEELSLGETLYYELQDNGSGLSICRAVIEDDDEQYKKIVWLEDIGGNHAEDQILWDGKFADGTQAGWGEYFITLKISDAAGNETMKSAVVTVNPFSFLQVIPAFIPPASSTSSAEAAQSEDQGSMQFGGENNNDQSSGESVTTNAGGIQVVWPEGTMGEAAFSISSITTSNSLPVDPNILWGAAATALVGASLAEWERQREEERKRQEAEEAAAEKRANTEKRQAQKAAEEAVRDRWEEEAREERANDASTARWEGLAAMETAKAQDRVNDADAARWAGVAAIAQAKEEERLNDASAARWAGVATIEQAKLLEETSLFDKWTSPSLPSGSIYGQPGWVDLLPPLVKLPLELFYENQSNKTPVNVLPDNKFFNFINNVGSHNSGLTTQLINDLTMGGYGWLTGWQPENGSQQYQEGRETGRILSDIYAKIEIGVGALLMLSGGIKFIASIGGTGGCTTIGGPVGGATCAAVTTPIAIAGVTEMLGGLVLGGHGSGILWNNANNPLQVRGEGDGGSKARPEGKTEAELDTYADARKEGTVGESDHVDDGTSSVFDFIERLTGMRWDAKKPVPTLFRSAEKQAQDIAKHIKVTPTDVPTYINLKNFTEAEKDVFLAEFKRLGVDMSKVVFVNK